MVLMMQNSDMFDPPSVLGQDLLKEVYERRRIHFYLLLFSFPVKLRTYLGKPLHCGVDETPTEFAERVSTL